MTKKTNTNENFLTVIVPAVISATSNKVSKDFKQETPTKTVYFNVTDSKKVDELVSLGMTQYTPDDENAEPYFIAKATKKVKVFINKDEFIERDFSVETPNINTNDEQVYLSVVKVKGEKGKNDFFRINAILVSDYDQIKEVEAQKPFASLFED